MVEGETQTQGGQAAGIPIFETRKALLRDFRDASEASLTAYVTIGTGETRVTLLDQDGRDIMAWTAVFGWAEFAAIVLDEDTGQHIHLSDERMLTQATSGQLIHDGGLLDTSHFIESAIATLNDAVGEILSRTIGSEARVGGVILAAPSWMHGLMRFGVTDLRGDISPNILDMP